MNISTVKLAPFSPTSTTKAVLQAFAQGFGAPAELVDITRPEVREQPLNMAEGELLVVGAPVYMGRIPALMGPWLKALGAEGSPVVCVVVYGNRAYEDALIELADAVAKQGGIPVAGAAFIGEHSFSVPATPTAQGRPDADDLELAKDFGRKVREKLDAVACAQDMVRTQVPGNRPYGGTTAISKVDFIEVGEDCQQCGLCATLCPVEGIDPEDGRSIDQDKCIHCCACIKGCPEGARSIKPGPIKDAQARLNANCSEPRQPEWFL